MSLAEYQEAFTAALLKADFDSTKPLTIPYLDNTNLGTLQFMAQRDRTFDALYTQLATIYQTTEQILGEEVMREMARAYFHKHPPQNPHPVDSMEMFAFYLEDHPNSKRFPFLPDIATMDLGFHKAYHAVDAETIRTSIFTEMQPEMLAAKRIQLHPACYWFSSSFSIHDIWRMHRAPIQQRNINHLTPQDVIFVRPHLNVELHKIDTGFTIALDKLDSGDTIEVSFTRATQVDRNFNAVAAIQFLIQNNVIVALY